jgi:ribA/ribD-fused uncharacterized protein
MYPVRIHWEGITYHSSEHAYVASKTNDRDKKLHIARIECPKQAKKFGRTLKLRADWESVKIPIMYQIVKKKFTENGDLGNMLIFTGNAHIEETNTWNDTFWGVCNGKGKNILGEILMKVRDVVKQQRVRKGV